MFREYGHFHVCNFLNTFCFGVLKLLDKTLYCVYLLYSLVCSHLQLVALAVDTWAV